VIFPV